MHEAMVDFEEAILNAHSKILAVTNALQQALAFEAAANPDEASTSEIHIAEIIRLAESLEDRINTEIRASIG